MNQQSFSTFHVDLDGVIAALTARLASNRAQISTLLAMSDKTFLNFVRPFDMIDARLGEFFTPVSHLHSVNNSEKTQEVYAEALPLLTEYSTEIGQNLAVYNAFKQIKAREYEQLTPERRRVLDLHIQHFELSGAHLDTQHKARLAEINLRKSDLTNRFSQNLLDATNAFEQIITDPADVAGIPPSDLKAAQITTETGETAWRFTLQMPSYIAYMTYGPRREIRETLYKAYTTRAPENGEIIDELLALRRESATLLGFETYADYSLATKMADTPQHVIDFLETLLEQSRSQAAAELDELQALADVDLQSFDTAFYAEKLKKAKYAIDEEEYRPYFEQKAVIDGLFTFLHRLFGIRFAPAQTEPLWDTKASAYDLYVEDRLRARLYLDLEARKSKRGGAWMHNWQNHCRDENDREQLASAFIVCNFPPSSDAHPSLLRHDDVVTLFHEMGHTLHHLLSTVNESSVSGVEGVEWDAVEFPSQFLENFAYEPRVLRLFARHHESGEVISDGMIERLVRAKNFQSALSMLRQLEFSLFDFMLHMQSEPDPQTLLDTLRERTALIRPPSYNRFQNGFSHIFSGGYAAGYYSYKWAEVLSADAYFAIVDQGIFDTQLGKDYLEIILARGGSAGMRTLFHQLMGRESDPSALLRLYGIAA